MKVIFISVAIISIIGATVLFIIRKNKESDLAGNLCFVFILVGLLSIGCYALDVDELFKKEYSTEYKQVAASAVTMEQNNGRPVKSQSEKDNLTTTTATQETDTVYITKSGTKYHLTYTCGGNEYYECTLKQALERNLTPCQKCAQ